MVCLKCKKDLPAGAQFCAHCGTSQDFTMAVNREREEAAKAAADAERTRVSSITALCKDFGIDAKEYIDSGAKVEVVNAAVLEVVKKGLKPPVSASADVTTDADDKKGAVMSASMLLASGRGSVEDRKAAKVLCAGTSDDIRPTSPLDLVRKVAMSEGIPASKLLSVDAHGLYNLALEMAGKSRPSMNSINPAHLTSVLADVQNKVMNASYAAQPTTYQEVADVVTVKDFKSVKMIQTSGLQKLKQMASGAGFEYTGMRDKQETGSLATFGLAARLPRELWINDDMNGITDFPMKFGASAARTINELFYDTLTSNTHQGPASAEDTFYMIDTTNHGNVGTTALPTNASIAEAEQLLSVTKGVKSGDSETAPIVPYRGRYVIGGTLLNLLMFQLTQSTADPASGGNSGIANFVSAGGYIPILDGYLGSLAATLGHTKMWYLQADRMFSPLVVLKLQGYETPTIRSAPSQVGEAVGITFDCLWDFNIAMRDWRGIIWNQGT